MRSIAARRRRAGGGRGRSWPRRQPGGPSRPRSSRRPVAVLDQAQVRMVPEALDHADDPVPAHPGLAVWGRKLPEGRWRRPKEADLVVSTRIDWVRGHCRLLRAIAAEFARTRPFDGLTIGTGIHLEAKTVALLLTLRDGGARLVSTGNLNTTQPDAVSRLRAEGVTVIGGPTKDSFNLAGPRPVGNSIESMDLGFALQARCLEAVARRHVDAASCVVPVPRPIDEAVARGYLDLKYPAAG